MRKPNRRHESGHAMSAPNIPAREFDDLVMAILQISDTCGYPDLSTAEKLSEIRRICIGAAKFARTVRPYAPVATILARCDSDEVQS